MSQQPEPLSPEDFSEELHSMLAKVPGAMRAALYKQEPHFAYEMAHDYLHADRITQLDIAAFFDSNGPKVVHDLKTQHEDGTPTSHDLAGWPTEEA